MPARCTVIVPLYNSVTTIGETIESLREQTFTDWECVVVNDGSTDAGPALVESLMAREPRIRMVSQTNRGLAGARNRGIEECRTELVHFLDADDWMTPRGLEWLIDAAGETGLSYGGYEHRDDAGRALGRQSPVSAPVVGLDELLEWNRAATHAHLFSREAIGEQRFDETLPCVEDYDMWLRLAARGARWQAVERIVAGYRLRPNSMSKQFGAMAASYQGVVRNAFDDAARLGWAERGGGKADLSDRRFRRVVGNMTLTYATMDALVDPSPSKARAAMLYDGSARPDFVSPATIANTASVALLFGACTAPDIDGWSERRWLSPLRQWWVRCAEDGWIAFDQIDGAFAEFARKVVHPDAIVEDMLGVPARCVVVIGLEKNGRRLVRCAAARGLRVLAFDDCSDQAEIDLLSGEERSEWGDRVAIIRDPADLSRALARDAAADAGAPLWLIGPMEGKALDAAERIAAVAAPKHIERWADVRNRLGESNLVRIRHSLDQRRALAG